MQGMMQSMQERQLLLLLVVVVVALMMAAQGSGGVCGLGGSIVRLFPFFKIDTARKVA